MSKNPTPVVLSLRSNSLADDSRSARLPRVQAKYCERGTDLYHRSIASKGSHCPAWPPGSGCANPATALNKFLPTSCANRTGSGDAVLPPVVTSAVEVAGLAATAAADCPSAASCASTDSSGSHRIPSVAVEEAPPPPALVVLPKAVEEAAEGMNVPRSRKMADGLALVRLRNSTHRSVGRCFRRLIPQVSMCSPSDHLPAFSSACGQGQP